MIHPVIDFIFGNIVRLFIRKVYGLRNLPSEPYVLAANHDSYLDPFVIYFTLIKNGLKHKIHWLALKGRFWKFFGNRLARDWAGCVPLDEGKKKALRDLISLLKKGDNVALFPSGARSVDGNITKGRTGVARIALAVKVPIIPVGIIGTYEIAPGNRLLPHLKRAEVKYGKPMYFDKYYGKRVTKKMLHEITDKVMLEVARLTGKRYERK
jgi:1-acyl-sn-glycerol-3-phosphate acyltransferase